MVRFCESGLGTIVLSNFQLLAEHVFLCLVLCLIIGFSLSAFHSYRGQIKLADFGLARLYNSEER